MINDATKLTDTSNWNTKPATSSDDGWKLIQNKKSSMNNISRERLESMCAAMHQTKITVVLRVPQDTEEFSAAETHLNTIRELTKQDSNLVVLDSKGVNHVNIHKAFNADKYIEYFQPREKKLPNGTIQISVAHHVLSEISNFNKALLIPFLKKNRVYVHFNQKEGLEHFSAIGVIFGPHPELTWRDRIIEKIKKTMKADISEEECGKIQTTFQKPKIVISMVPQIISNPKYSNTKSIALEIRVPATHENVYLNILDRLNERASTLQDEEVDLTLDEQLGKFFPYYAKRSRPKLFESLMRKQNTDMSTVSAIPLFGVSPDALDYEVSDSNGTKQSVRNWIHGHPNIQSVERTASTKDLGKFLLIVDRDSKEDVEDFLDGLFAHIPESNQIAQFKKPQRGGNSFQKQRINNINNYLNKLEERVNADLLMYDDDEHATTPPTRPRRLTISYAQATRRLSFQNETTPAATKIGHAQSMTATLLSTLTLTSLDEAMSKM
jgi:hypothetical protein